MTSTIYYTDCDYCNDSVPVTKFVSDYFAQGGKGEIYCDDCAREIDLIEEW